MTTSASPKVSWLLVSVSLQLPAALLDFQAQAQNPDRLVVWLVSWLVGSLRLLRLPPTAGTQQVELIGSVAVLSLAGSQLVGT